MIPTISHGIDHVHVYVPSREAAADWYRTNFGFQVEEDLRFWAKERSGPLTISDASGAVHLALFRSTTPKPFSLAFRATASEYLAWLDHFRARAIKHHEGDHARCWSLYCADPYDNEIEITSWDYQEIVDAKRIRRQ